MNEPSLKELLANWKCAWAYIQGEERALNKYTKLPYSRQELEEAIKKELPKGGVLQAYAEINREWEEKLENRLYDEIMRLYELCEGKLYFDISEVEYLLYSHKISEWDEDTHIRKCMNIIMKAPINVQVKNKVYDTQYVLFHLGKEEEVWYAYQYKKLFPKEMLEKLYERIQEETYTKRAAWIVAWLNH